MYPASIESAPSVDALATMTAMSGDDSAAGRAVALLRELDSHKTDAPQIAEPSHRLMARVIDAVTWFVIGAFWSTIAYSVNRRFFVEEGDAVTADPARLDPTVAWSAFAVIVLSIFALETIPTARTGQHFAKLRFGLIVVGPDGRPPGLWRASTRLCVWWLPAMLGMIVTGAWGSTVVFAGIVLQIAALAIPARMFFDDDHRGWHDRIAGTHVVTER